MKIFSQEGAPLFLHYSSCTDYILVKLISLQLVMSLYTNLSNVVCDHACACSPSIKTLILSERQCMISYQQNVDAPTDEDCMLKQCETRGDLLECIFCGCIPVKMLLNILQCRDGPVTSLLLHDRHYSYLTPTQYSASAWSGLSQTTSPCIVHINFVWASYTP